MGKSPQWIFAQQFCFSGSVRSRRSVNPCAVSGTAKGVFHFHRIGKIPKGAYLYFIDTVLIKKKGGEAFILKLIQHIFSIGAVSEFSGLHPVVYGIRGGRVLYGCFV